MATAAIVGRPVSLSAECRVAPGVDNRPACDYTYDGAALRGDGSSFVLRLDAEVGRRYRKRCTLFRLDKTRFREAHCTDFTVESGEPSHRCDGHNCDPFGNYNGPTGSAATAVQATIFPPGSAGGSEAWQTGDWDTTAWFAFQVGGRPWTATRGQTFAESEGCSAGCMDGQSGCGSWARMGECENNPSWMTTRCSHSCNTCWSDAECREQVPGSSYRYFPGDSTPATYA